MKGSSTTNEASGLFHFFILFFLFVFYLYICFFLFLYPPGNANHAALMLTVLRDDTCLSREPRLPACLEVQTIICLFPSTPVVLNEEIILWLPFPYALWCNAMETFFFLFFSCTKSVRLEDKYSFRVIFVFTSVCIAAGEERRALGDTVGLFEPRWSSEPLVFMALCRLFMGQANRGESTRNGSFKGICGLIWQGSNINAKVN